MGLTHQLLGMLRSGVMIIVNERKVEGNSVLMDKEYQVYWAKKQETSWISEFLLLLIQNYGIKGAIDRFKETVGLGGK